jgi:hypothetical protein
MGAAVTRGPEPARSTQAIAWRRVRAPRAGLRRVPVRIWIVMAVAVAGVAFGHDQPEDEIADYVMTDWMLITAFLGFMVPALLVTLIAWRRGFFHDLEGEVKTFWLSPEPDYETPPWAWEEIPDWARRRTPEKGDAT